MQALVMGFDVASELGIGLYVLYMYTADVYWTFVVYWGLDAPDRGCNLFAC